MSIWEGEIYMDSSILETYLDCNIFQPTNVDIPYIKTKSIVSICEELHFAILTGARVMLYGDYDADGLFSMLVWKEVFDCIGYSNYFLYQYTKRTHHISPFIVQQAIHGNAEYIIICDTGCSVEDQNVLTSLKQYGLNIIVIDHHSSKYDYDALQREINVFNSFEEQDALNGDAVSGAYAALLVANVLCLDFLHKPLANNAKCYALASMYSDVVDLSTKIGVALYNNVVLQKLSMPAFMRAFNRYNYRIGKRFFQYIFNPPINACFRSEHFEDLNFLLSQKVIYKKEKCIENILELHQFYSKLAATYSFKFTQERFGNLLCCVYNLEEGEKFVHIRNFSGLIANNIASAENCAVVVLFKMKNNYQGSFRDPFKRNFLSFFELFCNAGGHPPAFGITVPLDKIDFFKKNLIEMGARTSDNKDEKYIYIPSECIETISDLQIVALYNEYMNTNKSVVLKVICKKVSLIKSTSFYKYYNVDLPLQVTCVSPLMRGSILLVEPCICKDIQLKEVALL